MSWVKKVSSKLLLQGEDLEVIVAEEGFISKKILVVTSKRCIWLVKKSWGRLEEVSDKEWRQIIKVHFKESLFSSNLKIKFYARDQIHPFPQEEDQNVRQEYAEIIIKQINILNNMTKDILDFAKGKTTILPVKHAVDKLLDDFTKVFKPDVEKKGFKFESACNAQAMIYIDPEKITRVFMNIMKNAIEAMDEGGKFSITANQVNGEIEFLLSDTGEGIPAEIRDKLFDSFVTSGKKGGTGLGLAIVKKLIDQHKGRIEVDSEPGKGTTFKIYFKRL